MRTKFKKISMILAIIICSFWWIPLAFINPKPSAHPPNKDNMSMAKIQREKVKAAKGKPVLINTWKVGDDKYPEVHRRYCYENEDGKMECYITVNEGGH